MFSVRGLRLHFPLVDPWVVRSVSLPSCSSRFICMPMWTAHSCGESSPPGCRSPPLLPVWMSISSLTAWLSDFHTVQSYVSSGHFLFLNLLLSFFWLCKKAQCVYLRLHLGRKSEIGNLDASCFLSIWLEARKSAFLTVCLDHLVFIAVNSVSR